jgi:putative cardiolipin synthase
VTFPDDPAFADVLPGTLGFDQLFSALASAAKQSSDQIVLVVPFFEGGGFERLHDILIEALERGVDLTIVTRYLADRSSHNRHVLADFADRVRDEGPFPGTFSAVDYTVWDDGIPPAERTQDGATPAFTLHAKLMTFDDHTVYVGSANVTDYGFDRYLELGVLLRGPPVSAYTELCRFLLTSAAATEVRL